MTADTATTDAFAAGQREAREADRVALVTALGADPSMPWADLLAGVCEDVHAICPNCVAETDECDEDRCCLTCGADLVVVADGHSADVLLSALAAAGESGPREPRMSGGDDSPTVAVLHPAEAILPLRDAASRYATASDAGIARESEPGAPVTTIYDVEGDL